MLPEHPIARRSSQQRLGHRQVELVGGHVLADVALLLATLHVGPVLAHAQHDLAGRAGDQPLGQAVGPDRERGHRPGVDVAQALHQRVQAGEVAGRVAVEEALEHAQAVGGGVRDQVEDLLQARGEVVVHERGEVLLHQAGHAERQERRDQRGALLAHVAAVDDRRDDRRVRRGPADAALLEVLDQRRLGVARRRGRGVALGAQLGAPQGVALAHRRQPPVGRPTAALGPGLVVADLVRALLVGREEPGEQGHRARRGELDVPAVRGAGTQPHSGRRQPRIGHLGGDRALPDQLVQRELVGARLDRPAPRDGRTSPPPDGSPRAPPGRS